MESIQDRLRMQTTVILKSATHLTVGRGVVSLFILIPHPARYNIRTSIPVLRVDIGDRISVLDPAPRSLLVIRVAIAECFRHFFFLKGDKNLINNEEKCDGGENRHCLTH